MAYRIDNGTSSPTLPTPGAVGVNPNSYFTKGDPSLGTPATIVDDDWVNSIQEELSQTIEAAGITLDKTKYTQLKQAIDFFAQRNGAIYAASTTAANTYTATLSPVPPSYTNAMGVLIKFTNANTGAATLNLNTLGAKSIKRLDGSDLLSGDIYAGMFALMFYDGTNFQLINPLKKSPSVQSVTTTTTLTASAFSSMIVCTGASSYAVTLPSVTSNANKIIDFIVLTTSNALVTLTPASGTIDSQSTMVFGKNESGRLFCDGTNWVVMQKKIEKPAFRATIANNQSIPNDTLTKMNFDTIIRDTHGFFDTTNHRYVPKLPGTYCFITQGLLLNIPNNSTVMSSTIYKNGSYDLLNQFVGNVSTGASANVQSILQMNGTTDYVEGYVYQKSGAGSLTLNNDPGETIIEGFRIDNI